VRRTSVYLFNLSTDQLHLLDEALDGRLSVALADAARSGGDLELRAVRERANPARPSKWTLVVRAGHFERHMMMDEAITGLGVVAHIFLTDIVDDLKADLAASVQGRVPSDEPLTKVCHRREEPS